MIPLPFVARQRETCVGYEFKPVSNISRALGDLEWPDLDAPIILKRHLQSEVVQNAMSFGIVGSKDKLGVRLRAVRKR